MTENVRVMVVNDSAYMTELLCDIIMSGTRMEVSERARDGVEAIRKLRRNRPDVVLLDLEMPNMDGLTFLEQVMRANPVPVVVVSSYSQRGAQIVFDSLECGAVDFVPIPEDEPEKLRRFKDKLISKIRVAARTNLASLKPLNISSRPITRGKSVYGVAPRVVIIGASTGGPRVLSHVLSALPPDLPAGLLVVQHMPNSFTTNFAQHLNENCRLKVSEAKEGDIIREGGVLLAPGDYHMLVKPPYSIKLNHGPKRFGVRPAINMTMISASEVYGANTVGVLLSGIGHDGAFGMKMIRKRGGIAIAQDETSSVVFGMAKAACDLHAVDKIVPAEKIPGEIVKAVERHVR